MTKSIFYGSISYGEIMIKLNIISKTNKYDYLIEELKSKILDRFEKKKIEEIFKFENDIELNMYIDTKEGLDQYVLLNSESYRNNVPSWVTGFSNEKCVYIAIDEDNISDSIKTCIHELIHLLSYNLKVKDARIRLLEEGLAYYYANQMTTGRFSIIKEDFKTNKIQKFKNLINMNSQEFANNNGYFYGFFLVKFLNNNYDNDKIIFYIKNSKEFLKDLDKIQIEFEKYMSLELEKYK